MLLVVQLLIAFHACITFLVCTGAVRASSWSVTKVVWYLRVTRESFALLKHADKKCSSLFYSGVAYILKIIVQSKNVATQENEMTVSESLQRVNDGSGEQFSMDSQVIVCVRDTTKYLPIVNLLTEKLDSHVTISAPDFSHDSVTLEQSRYTDINTDTAYS